jgi:hypothetical protein
MAARHIPKAGAHVPDDDEVGRAPESGEAKDRQLHPGTPVSDKTDDVRYAPESGDRTRDPRRK